jgi:2-polyprenyl-6-methoxyphenol hydroxylase-like FAD-dependent oxidoreductase
MRGDGVRVLVVGAGIAGLAAARTLRAWGADVEIVERSGAARVDGAGIYLPGNAVRALDDLGLGARVAARAVEIRRQRVSDHRGRSLMDLAMAVEDALVLADCLAAAGTIAGALRAFEERRRPRTEWVRAQTHRRDRSRSLPTPVRNLVLGRLGVKLFHASYKPLRERP